MAKSLNVLLDDLYEGPLSQRVSIISGFDAASSDYTENAMGGNSFMVSIAPETAQKLADICSQIPRHVKNISINVPPVGFAMQLVEVENHFGAISGMESDLMEKIKNIPRRDCGKVGINLSRNAITFSNLLETSDQDYEASVHFQPEQLLDLVKSAQENEVDMDELKEVFGDSLYTGDTIKM